MAEKPEFGFDSYAEQNFRRMVKDLRNAAFVQNMDQTENEYIALKRFLLGLTDNYDYLTPPQITMIENCIAETEQAFGKNDLVNVAYEMEEARVLFKKARKLLFKSGVSPKDIDTFQMRIHEIRDAGRAGESEKIKAKLPVIKKLFKAFQVKLDA